VPKSILEYNKEAVKGKDAAMKYCRAWGTEITTEGAALAAELAGKKIDMLTYKKKREALNKQTTALNECIQSINQQFGR